LVNGGRGLGREKNRKLKKKKRRSDVGKKNVHAGARGKTANEWYQEKGWSRKRKRNLQARKKKETRIGEGRMSIALSLIKGRVGAQRERGKREPKKKRRIPLFAPKKATMGPRSRKKSAQERKKKDMDHPLQGKGLPERRKKKRNRLQKKGDEGWERLPKRHGGKKGDGTQDSDSAGEVSTSRRVLKREKRKGEAAQSVQKKRRKRVNLRP